MFLFLSLVSYFWSEANKPSVATYSLIKSLLIIIPVLFLNFGNDHLEKLIKVYFYGTVFGSLQVIYNYYFKAEFYYGIKRSFILGIDSNESAIFIALGFSLALFYYFNSKKIWYLLCCFPQIVAVFYTGSRTGFVSIFICTIMSLFFFKIIKFNAKSLLLIPAIVGIFYLLPLIVPAENIQRIMHTSQDLSAGEMSGRSRIWAEAIRLIPNKLVYGYGMNSFNDILEKHFMRFNAHNVFLKSQFELGLIGSLIFLIWLIYFAKKLIGNDTYLKSFLVISFIIIIISFMQLSWIYSVNLMVLISLLLNTLGNYNVKNHEQLNSNK
jgi:O-antigen ligase